MKDEAVCTLFDTERETVMWNGIKINYELDGAVSARCRFGRFR